MSQPFRLPAGGRIDRSRTIGFTFNGQHYEGHPGDTLASALFANGVRLVGRSFKYHRPRGIMTAAFLGYLRWVSGSVWPPMLAHFGNNAASAVIVLVQPDDSPDTLPLWVGVVGAAFTVACCIVARAMIARRAL